MRMKIYLWMVLVLIMAACTNEEPEGVIVSKNYIKAGNSLQLQGEGQQAEITIEANCPWNISGTQDWLVVTPTNGSGTQRVTIAATRNLTGTARSADLTIQGGNLPQKVITVTQSDATKEPGASDNQPPT
jgi:hypothetical protein